MVNFRSLKKPLPGFTMVELLVIIVILFILAGIVIMALRPGNGTDIKQTSITLKNTQLKLEEYAADHNGLYPIGEDGSSAILYRKLSGDESGQGNPPSGPVYWKELNSKGNSSLVGTREGKRVILDGFENSLRYRAALDENQQMFPGVKNTDHFDLWSTGPDGEPSDINTPGTLTNEHTKDDIWN